MSYTSTIAHEHHKIPHYICNLYYSQNCASTLGSGLGELCIHSNFDVLAILGFGFSTIIAVKNHS